MSKASWLPKSTNTRDLSQLSSPLRFAVDQSPIKPRHADLGAATATSGFRRTTSTYGKFGESFSKSRSAAHLGKGAVAGTSLSYSTSTGRVNLPSLQGSQSFSKQSLLGGEPQQARDDEVPALGKTMSAAESFSRARAILARSQPELEALERDLQGREETLDECFGILEAGKQVLRDAGYRIEERGHALAACKNSPVFSPLDQQHVKSREASRACEDAMRRINNFRSTEFAWRPSEFGDAPSPKRFMNDSYQETSTPKRLPSWGNTEEGKSSASRSRMSSKRSTVDLSPKSPTSEWNPQNCLLRRSTSQLFVY
eukprot:TRINITY_DN22684_c1_g1_i1.p1 TRINITY_DN22684_c1_g1~~TRINITY_DN22684_c1_g1_i1.p1  ORF type:complete len:313 (+),score=42.72 TRINITY_DN22684_c1_g1_i1:191-1129(+)